TKALFLFAAILCEIRGSFLTFPPARCASGSPNAPNPMCLGSSEFLRRVRFRQSKRFSTLPFLNLPICEMQETSYWAAHPWNVMSEQRKSNWQHPNTY